MRLDAVEAEKWLPWNRKKERRDSGKKGRATTRLIGLRLESRKKGKVAKTEQGEDRLPSVAQPHCFDDGEDQNERVEAKERGHGGLSRLAAHI